jgi:drug/metabolite transporter (DMT)-like permease
MRKALPLNNDRTGATDNVWAWMGIALLAHTSWGAYPVLARYLQTISQLPSMSLLALGNLIVLGLYTPFVIRRVGLSFLRSRAIWALAFVAVLRAMTNVIAARYTLAIYVQLVTLMTPLIVALLSAGLFREKLPPLTFPVIGFSLLGSLLMMSGSIGAGGLQLNVSGSDWIGLTMALTSAFCLAFYMILVSRTVKVNVPGGAVLLVQLVVMTLSTGAISLLFGEDWGRYAAIGWSDWAVFGLFIVGVLMGANLGQIAALRHLGAPMVSSIMAWRLISTLMLAALLLGEWLTSIWQVLGAVIVLVTITVYLRRQRS